MAKTPKEVNKWPKHSGTPRNGSSTEGSQSMAELLGTTRKGQEMTEVAWESQEMAGMSEKAKKW
ncbi:hypothetical protein Taro_043592 [Colocasia esculenta]|uniref:Uncharacterized protein n=1 Tax=Colocasia esculenta TaxID=4460 RepID=A0A843X1T7_COLES|nr:hypothetical protein [Colocasia esculenta]